MAHQHPVVDSDIRFAINPITKAITRVEAKKSSLVVGDHNSERFTFEIPKIVEGHDMTLCNVVRVHYINTSSDNKSLQSLGVYEVDDFAIDSDDENLMKFTWLISRKATKYVGPLAFTIQFACMTGFRVDYSWQSGIFSGITVANAINGAEVVIEEYADILRQWWEQLYASSDLPITVMPVEDFEALNGNTRNGMLYILTGDPAVEDLEKIPSIEQHMTTLDTKLANVEEKVEDELEPAIKTINEKSIPTIKNNMTSLNTRLVNVEEKIEDEVDPAIKKIPGIEQNVTNVNTRLVNVEETIPDIQQNMTVMDANLLSVGKKVDKNTTGLTAVREAVAGIDSKWRWGEYTKLYEYDTEDEARAITFVIDGLYMIKAEYFDTAGNYSASMPVILDTSGKGSALTSFSIPAENGTISNYVIRSGAIENSGSVMEIIPYYVNLSGQCDYSYTVKNIRLYGRRIYTNPINIDMSMSYKRPFVVTPITEIRGDDVLHYLRVMGVCRVVSDDGSEDAKFEGYLYLNSASPAAVTVTGTSVKSNKGVIETSLGDIEIIDDISIYGENAKVSVIDNNLTLYCENVAVYLNSGSIYQDFALVDMNNNSSIPVSPLTEINGDSVLHYLRVTGRYKLEDVNGYIEKDFESFLYLKSDSMVNFTVTGASIKSNKGVIETSLGDIEITGDISDYGPNTVVSIVDNTFTLYCAVVHEALG